ncbi:hypothetical protein [Thiobacillus denitrificans]|nr:hypothetical protein [Thiobacillus denitrificans]
MDDIVNALTNLGAWGAGLVALAHLAANAVSPLVYSSVYCF